MKYEIHTTEKLSSILNLCFANILNTKASQSVSVLLLFKIYIKSITNMTNSDSSTQR